jgi:hypothetical protein
MWNVPNPKCPHRLFPWQRKSGKKKQSVDMGRRLSSGLFFEAGSDDGLKKGHHRS